VTDKNSNTNYYSRPGNNRDPINNDRPDTADEIKEQTEAQKVKSESAVADLDGGDLKINPKTNRNKLMEVKNLHIAYNTDRGKLHAVNGVDFSIYNNETTAVIGESGCGKTTLCLALLKLTEKNARYLSGEIIYQGDEQEKNILKLDEGELRKLRWSDISLVFQASQSVFNPVIKIKEHFIDTVRAHQRGLSAKKILKRARNLLEQMQLDADRVLSSYAHELSGGMKQRTLIALSFILEPKIVIFDEPTTALDVLTQRKILDLLKTIKEKNDFSLIIITHDLAISAELADNVATMYAGKIVEYGPVESIYYQPRHPYSYGLIKAVPKIVAGEGEEGLTSITGKPPDLIEIQEQCSFAPRCDFASSKCYNTIPSLNNIAEGHQVACFNYQEVPSIKDGSHVQNSD